MYRRLPAPAPRLGRPARETRTGFTLVELLVVITVIAMLVGLLIPAIQAAREAGRRNTCLNNQRQIGTAVVNYVTSKDRFPPLYSVQPQPTGSPAPLNPRVGWVPPLLSHLEQNPLYQAFQNNQWALPGAITNAQVSTLICPSRNPTSTPAPSSYVVNAGVTDWFTSPNTTNPPMDYPENGVFFDEYAPAINPMLPKAPIIDISYLSKRRGAVRTLLCSESLTALDWIQLSAPAIAEAPPQPVYTDGSFVSCSAQAITWFVQQSPAPPADWGFTTSFANMVQASPAILPTYVGVPSSNHSGGFIVTYCDGHAQFMSADVTYRVYCLLLMTDGTKARDPQYPMFKLPDQWYISTTTYGEPIKPITDADLGG